MLDDHATDSNHKKTLGMVSTLCRSYRQAIDMLDHAKTYYHNLTTQVGDTAVQQWTVDIEATETNCKYNVTVMDIYAAKLASAGSESDNRQPASGTPFTQLAS